jgi:hypothetical protein
MSRTVSRDLGRTFAAIAIAAFGLLGWLFVQWMTFGIVEHSHMTSAGVVDHHHPYAGPLAVAASMVALASLLAIFAVHRGPSPRVARPTPGRLLIPTALAAGLFVLVESIEFHGAGRLHEPAALGVLLLGATLEVLVLPMFWAIGCIAALAAQHAASGLEARSWTGRPAAADPVAVAVAVASFGRRASGWSWDGRAPPGDARLLLSTTTPTIPVPVTRTR